MEKDVEIGIFGGTGIYDSGILENAQEIIIDTPYGKPSDSITVGIFKGRKNIDAPKYESR
jgi:5'-methylthioadenosine phosphorylase